MTILEILEAHTVKRPWSEATRMKCKCGQAAIAETETQLYALHRAHVAGVLEKHMQERETKSMEAWQLEIVTSRAEAWEECARSIVYEDGTPIEIASITNPYKETE